MYTCNKYVFVWESRPNYGFHTMYKKKRKHRQSVLTDRQTDGHTHTHTHTSYTAASTAVYTPSVLSPGWFWHRHRSQTTSHISNANCPSGQKWSTSVEYRNEFQTEEQLGGNTLEWATLLNQRYKTGDIHMHPNISLIYNMSFFSVVWVRLEFYVKSWFVFPCLIGVVTESRET